jgi:hypothetical protein
LNLPVVWEATMLFFTLSNTNVKVALLFCKEKEMTLNAKCFKQIFLKGKKYGKMQYEIKNISAGGKITDLTVSVKKGGWGVGDNVYNTTRN